MNRNKRNRSESKLMVAVVATTLLIAQIPISQAAGVDARRDARAVATQHLRTSVVATRAMPGDRVG